MGSFAVTYQVRNLYSVVALSDIRAFGAFVLDGLADCFNQNPVVITSRVIIHGVLL